IASVAASRGALSHAVSDQQAAQAILISVLGDEHTKTAAAHCNVGATLYRAGGSLELAADTLVASMAAFEKAYGSENPAVALVLNNLGLVYHAQGQFILARSAHERSLAIRREAFGAGHPAVSVALINLALVMADMSQLNEAMAHHDE